MLYEVITENQEVGKAVGDLPVGFPFFLKYLRPEVLPVDTGHHEFLYPA